MRTLARMPDRRSPQKVRGAWPSDTYAKDPMAIAQEEFIAARHRLELPEKDQEEYRRDHLRKWSKSPPSATEIAQMEQALLWPGRYLDDAGRTFINLWANYVGVENTTKPLRMMFGISRKTVWLRAEKLCAQIADRLNEDRVPVL